MSETTRQEVGTINWTDLTVPNAEAVRDFYSKVVGWQPEPVAMGDYSDYNMNSPESGKPIAGVCHARGANANLPAQWMIYITVANLDESIAQCRAHGGKVLVGPKGMGGKARYCVIQDPAGAVAALYDQGE